MSNYADQGAKTLIDFVDKQVSAETDQDAPPLLPPPPECAPQRHVRECDPPDAEALRFPTVLEARQDIEDAIHKYTTTMPPGQLLLIRAKAGVGKTTAGVRAAEEMAAAGIRVAYAGPRHDFYQDIMAITSNPKLWYEWQPRYDRGPGDATCIHTRAITSWMAKGYQAIDFCSGICGWDYVGSECPYHAQKRSPEPIIFVQHQHVTIGHPLEFNVLIGDENPLGAFLNKYWLEAKDLMLPGLAPNSALYNLLSVLTSLAIKDSITQGPDLINALGGPGQVIKFLETTPIPDEVILYHDIHCIEDAAAAPHYFLPALSALLMREARHYAVGQTCIKRAFVGSGGMTLLLRRSVADGIPEHKIWLDATGNPHIYAELFRQEIAVLEANPEMVGHVHVISDRANGISNLVKNEKHIDQTKRLIQSIITKGNSKGSYTQPAVVTYKGLITEGNDGTQEAMGCQALNFYGARGTNSLESCDVLFVVGTPTPSQDVMLALASMVYINRNIPFVTAWSDKWLKYTFTDDQGRGREYPAGGYWADEDMAALEWQYREAEILQAVHRARPVHRDVDIYLLTNLPIDEIPVDSISTSREILGAPLGVDAFKWDAFETWATDQPAVSVSSIVRNHKIDKNTAREYIRRLLDRGWQLADDTKIYNEPGRRGPKPKWYQKMN